MTPTLVGRLQTRVFLAIIIGGLWTAIITPALPRPAGMPVDFAFRVTFKSLGIMVAAGLIWEIVYHLVQQLRWDKDWPSLFALFAVVPEAVLLWYLTHEFDVIPGTTGLSSPILSLFVIHVGTTWVLIWLFFQGPLRVLHFRWRFEGGRVLSIAPLRKRPQRFRRAGNPGPAGGTDVPEPFAGPSGPAPAVSSASGGVVPLDDPRAADGAGEPGGLIVGTACPNGHFASPGVPYCMSCGSALVGGGEQRVRGPRPPLGVLILDNGHFRPVDGDLGIVQPADTEFPAFVGYDRGAAGQYVAEIRLIGWQPVVLGSRRDMSVTFPGGYELRVGPRVPVPLISGAEFLLGDRRIHYQSPYC